jgi:hypothetical protein
MPTTKTRKHGLQLDPHATNEMEMMMIGLRVTSAVPYALAAFLALSLSLPAAAGSNPLPIASGPQEIGTAPAPEAAASGTCSRADASRPRRACQKVAAYAPMLFVGIGW